MTQFQTADKIRVSLSLNKNALINLTTIHDFSYIITRKIEMKIDVVQGQS